MKTNKYNLKFTSVRARAQRVFNSV